MEKRTANKFNIIEYTLLEKLINLAAHMFMPYFGYMFFSDRINTMIWKILGCQIGAGSIIRRGTHINAPARVKIGCQSLIHGKLKSRGYIEIGSHVELVENVVITTQKHNINSSSFENIYQKVVIENECWLSVNTIVLDGITLAEGTVIAAGAVVTKSTESWGVYTGIPAKKTSVRKVVVRGDDISP